MEKYICIKQFKSINGSIFEQGEFYNVYFFRKRQMASVKCDNIHYNVWFKIGDNETEFKLPYFYEHFEKLVEIRKRKLQKII